MTDGADFAASSLPAASGPSARKMRPQPATRVLEGRLAAPLLSSRGRNWSGLTLELHSFVDLDTVVQGFDHVIAVHLAGAVQLHQTRGGRTRSRTMNTGDITITPVGPPTRWRQSGQSLVILLRLAPGYLQTVAGDECAIDPERFEIQAHFATRDPYIEHIGKQLLAGLELEGRDSRLYVDTHVCELAIHLLREYTTGSATMVWPKTQLSPHKLRRTIDFIDENLHGELTLNTLAQAVALSPGHFAHAFRAATGVTPHRYVVERRVETAKALLRQSDLPITEIAQRIGCSSHSHFSVQFHRVTGFTPRQYRNRE